MSSFLPSEVSRLVLGYLDEIECKSTYNAFLNECTHLAECRGRIFFTQIMGYSLVEMLDDFCAVQSYILQICKGQEFERNVLKCKTLLEKVTLLVSNDDNVTAKKSTVTKCHKQTSPHTKTSQSYSVHKSNRVRSNSCDSVVSTRTDVSGYGAGRLMDKRQPHTRSMESLAEATNLADLPGNKRCSIGCQTKAYGSSYKSYKDSVGKIDKTHRSAKCESEEESFKSALGLVRHSELAERHNNSSKAPLKGKSMGRKQGAVVKKISHVPDSLPNESLSVTTITHALLDCTEFHEKLAENINKIYSNLSNSKANDEVDISPHKTENAARDETAPMSNQGVLVPVSNSAPNVDENVTEEVPQLDSVIKSIVEKTEKDPIFDQLVNEVLAASVESSSASDSDLISRPSTSTPEKSSYSQMNESSPTWRPSDSLDKHCRSHFGVKKIHSNYRDKLRSRRMSPIKHTPYTQHQYYSRNMKYQRYPRGGKRMDILRETYGSSFCENEDDDDVPLIQHKSSASIAQTDGPSTSTAQKAEPKVVILSDEIVNTNIKTCKGQLIELPHIISVSKPEETLIKSCKDASQFTPISADINKYSHVPVNMVPSHTDPRLQARTVKLNDKPNQPMILKAVKGFENNPNVVQSMVNTTSNPVRFVNVEQNKPLLEVSPQVINVQPNNAITSDSGISSQVDVPSSCALRNYRKNSNFNPKLEAEQKANNFYSESDFMKMPTVFIESSDKVEDSQTFVSGTADTLSNTILPVQHSTELCNQEFFSLATTSNNAIVAPNLSAQSKAKLIYREKVPLKCVPGFIKSLVNDTDGTHVLQIDQSLMGLHTDSVLPLQSEIIIATRNESDRNIQTATNANKVEVQVDVENLQPNSNDLVQPESKTPNNNVIVPKTGSSTPKRSLSHVRVLDFNTPPRTYIEGRNAFSSPKLSTRSIDKANRRPFLTPSSTVRQKSKRIQSKLFPSIAESPRKDDDADDKSDVVKVEVIASGVWDEVQGVGQILKKSNESTKMIQNVVNSKIISIVEKPIKKSAKKMKVLKPVAKKPIDDKAVDKKTINKKAIDKKPIADKPIVDKPIDINYEIDDKEFEEKAAALEWARIRNASRREWDQEVRLMLSTDLPTKRIVTKQNSDQKKKKRNTSENCEIVNEEMSKSTEDEAKLLEDALNKTTGFTPVKPNIDNNDKDVKTDEDPLKLDGNVDEQTYDNFNSENNSCQSEVRSDEANSGNKDYLLQVKLFRDSMKSQQEEPCKFVTYSKPHKSNVHSPTTKQKKPSKVRNTFKVKFPAKNSKEIPVYDDDLIEIIEDDSNKEITQNTADAPITQMQGENVETNPQEIDASIPVTNSEPGTSKSQTLLTPIEPPVPSVKITPDMPREHDFNPLNAKCNLNLLLETPFKFEILDLHMDTPKFISPGFFKNSLSAIKISDIPTPSFPFLPELTKTPISIGKEPTPGSYSSRPTDYSSSSSYYKPDEIEFNLDVKGQLSANKEYPKCLSILTEEPETSPDDKETSKRVLRPRKSQTVYYPDTLNRSKLNSCLNKSNDKLNTSKSSNRTDTSKLDISKSKESIKSDEPSFNKNSSRHSNFSLSTSASSYDSFVDTETEPLSTLIKSSTPKVNNEKLKSEETRRQLEEKRKRVLSKLKMPTVKKKSYPKTKISIKGKRISNKLSLSNTSNSPKVTAAKVNVSSPSVGGEKEIKKEANVVSKETHSQIQAIKMGSSKSRRKSSTPRKLMQSENGSFTSLVADGDQQTKNDEQKSEIKDFIFHVSDKSKHNSSKADLVKAMNVGEDADTVDDIITKADQIGNEFETDASKAEISIECNVEKHFQNVDIVSKKTEKTGIVDEFNDFLDNADIVNKSVNNIVNLGNKISTVKNIDNQYDTINDAGGRKSGNAKDIYENIDDNTNSKNETEPKCLDLSNRSKDKIKNSTDDSVKSSHSGHLQDSKLLIDCVTRNKNVDMDVCDERTSADKHFQEDSSKKLQPYTEASPSNDEFVQIRNFIATTDKSMDNSVFKENLLKHGFDRTSVEMLDPELSEDLSRDSSLRKCLTPSMFSSSPDIFQILLKLHKLTNLPMIKLLHLYNQYRENPIPREIQDRFLEKCDANSQIDDCDGRIDALTNYDCNALSNNFKTYSYVSSKTKRKPCRPVDISRFKLKATVFNSLTEDDEVRDIEITELEDLVEIQPDRLKIQRLKRKDAKVRKEWEKERIDSQIITAKEHKKDPLEIMIAEMDASKTDISIDCTIDKHSQNADIVSKKTDRAGIVDESNNFIYNIDDTINDPGGHKTDIKDKFKKVGANTNNNKSSCDDGDKIAAQFDSVNADSAVVDKFDSERKSEPECLDLSNKSKYKIKNSTEDTVKSSHSGLLQDSKLRPDCEPRNQKKNVIVDVYDEHVRLYLSSDEPEQDSTEANTLNDELVQIRNFIATTNKSLDNSAFKENLLKQGFNKTSVEALELELSEAPSSDAFEMKLKSDEGQKSTLTTFSDAFTKRRDRRLEDSKTTKVSRSYELPHEPQRSSKSGDKFKDSTSLKKHTAIADGDKYKKIEKKLKSLFNSPDQSVKILQNKSSTDSEEDIENISKSRKKCNSQQKIRKHYKDPRSSHHKHVSPKKSSLRKSVTPLKSPSLRKFVSPHKSLSLRKLVSPRKFSCLRQSQSPLKLPKLSNVTITKLTLAQYKEKQKSREIRDNVVDVRKIVEKSYEMKKIDDNVSFNITKYEEKSKNYVLDDSYSDKTKKDVSPCPKQQMSGDIGRNVNENLELKTVPSSSEEHEENTSKDSANTNVKDITNTNVEECSNTNVEVCPNTFVEKGSNTNIEDCSNTNVKDCSNTNVEVCPNTFVEENDDCDEEIVVLTNYDCNALSNNFKTYSYVSSKTKRKPCKPMDISRFKIKATIFNSLTEDDEVREIQITELADLFEIQPDRLKLQWFKKKDAKKRRESEKDKIESMSLAGSEHKIDPLDSMMIEMENASESQSSCRSLEELQNIQIIRETDLAVKSILFDETSNHSLIKCDLDPSSTHEHLINTSDPNKTISDREEHDLHGDASFKEQSNLERDASKSNDECSDVRHSSKNAVSNSNESICVGEKRKRDDDVDEENSKKNKLSSPQSLLLKIDIDAVLSKLHGPK